MGKSLFLWLNVISMAMNVIQLFLPVFLRVAVHYDMNRRKFCFALYLFGFLRIFGGYIATYKGGLAMHVSEKKAFLLPYSQMESERKKYSFVKTFHLSSFTLTTETGAEYLLPVSLAHIVLRIYFFAQGGKKEKVENNLWLTDGDILRISINVTVWFTIFMLLKEFVKFLKEKIKISWQKRMKKSLKSMMAIL